MRCSCWSLGLVMFTTAKMLITRCEKALRPPPGGAMVASSCMSRMFFTSCLARSYQNPLSLHSFSSSSGGMNPNWLFCGMLKSSIYTTIFLPPAGANTPLERFSSLPSMVFCRLLDEVWALKLMAMELRPSGRESRQLCATMVLPTPTLPTIRQCFITLMSVSASVLVRSVSVVGTRILKNGMSAGGRYTVSLVSQGIHALVLESTKYSYTVSLGG
mmetsp:Transcript_29261/g.72382  ORF Transcript_29261/g.72382 Transcript_29261/m.72382 type:complete len:216 (-) Transcript_29261:1455-2102(-)